MPTSVWLDRSECKYDDGLPPVCMVCGADADDVVRRRFIWYPSWLIVTILLGVPGVVLMAVLSAVLAKRMAVHVPLCGPHRGVFARRSRTSSLLVVLSLGSLFAGLAAAAAIQQPGQNDDAPQIACGVAGGVGMVVLIGAALVVSSRGIRPQEITADDIRLKGVHEEFVAALKDQRREERERRRRRREEDDALSRRRPRDDDRPRRPVRDDEPDDDRDRPWLRARDE